MCSRKPIAFVQIFSSLALVATSAMARGDGLTTVDLDKLANPSTREVEVARLLKAREKSKLLIGYRLLDAPQKDGTGALRVLVMEGKYDFQLERHSILDGYKIDRPGELFDAGLEIDERSGIWSTLKPDLTVIPEQNLLVFDAKGREIRPFGDHDEIHSGYLFDFDRDGTLDFADARSVPQGEESGMEIAEFVLQTVAPRPRILLRVIYNWHPEEHHRENEWGFICYDEEGDGHVEIAFGPKDAITDQEGKQFVFRWNAKTQSYSAGEIPPKSHVRVVTAEEDLEKIASAGGLGYEVKRDRDFSGDDEDQPPPTYRPYVFQSLKDASDGEIWSFFQGQEQADSFFNPRGAVPNQVPPGFWQMAPKQAALAFAEANRTAAHRRNWKIAIDDRNNISAPASGWVVYDWTSSGCYSLSTHLFAIRFGTEQSWLLATDTNRNGAVGRNALADQLGCTVRVIPLKKEEASFLAGTLFWLDRLRSHSPHGEHIRSMGSSTADGSADLFILAKGEAPRRVGEGFNSVSATRPISTAWSEDYSPEVCINLVEYLLDTALPAYLGDRWKVAPEIDRRSLTTSLEDRLKPRLDTEGREQFIRHLKNAFERHRTDPLPTKVLEELVLFIGMEATLPLLPDMERLQASLPPADEEDAEFAALDKKFGGPGSYGELTPEEEKARDRYRQLQEEREHKMAKLREPLAETLKMLRISSDPKLLAKEAKAGGALSTWALDRLRKSYPVEWEDSLIMGFRDANLETKKNILTTLDAARPEAAEALLILMSPQETSDLLLEVAGIENKVDPDKAAKRIPAILDMLKDRKSELHRRTGGMELLGQMKLGEEQVAEFTTLLLSEIKNPQTDENLSSFSTLSAAVKALSQLPGASAHLDEIAAARGDFFTNRATLEALARLTLDRPDRKQRLEAYLRPFFTKSDGMMNDVFIAALALDLKGLAPDVAALASEKPSLEEGEGASSAGGGFKSPVNERYHLAREVTALWSETDPKTLGRMWVAFVAAHPYQFGSEDGDPPIDACLRKVARASIEALPGEERGRLIGETLSRLPGDYLRKQVDEVFADMDSW